MKGKRFWRFGLALAVFVGGFSMLAVTAEKAAPVTIYAKVDFGIPTALENPLFAEAELTLVPGPPRRAGLRYRLDAASETNLEHLKEALANESDSWPLAFTEKVSRALGLFSGVPHSDGFYEKGIALDRFDPLFEIYSSKGIKWDTVLKPEGFEAAFPTQVDYHVPLLMTLDPSQFFSALIPVKELVSVEGQSIHQATREYTHYRGLEVLVKRPEGARSNHRLLLLGADRPLPTILIGKDPSGGDVVVLTQDLHEFRTGRSPSLTLYTVHPQLLGVPANDKVWQRALAYAKFDRRRKDYQSKLDLPVAGTWSEAGLQDGSPVGQELLKNFPSLRSFAPYQKKNKKCASLYEQITRSPLEN